MNYKWKNVYDRSVANNLFYIYEATANDVQIKAYVYITFPILKLDNKRMVNTKIYFKTDDENFIYNWLHEISDDILELCCNVVDSKDKLINFSNNEYYAVNDLPNEIPVTFGDYSF